jgi:hypothetical protein
MENALFVTHTFDLAHLYVSVTSVITVHTRVGAPSVGDQVSRTPTIVRSARYRRKIEMAVQRLSILAVPKRICFMRERSMASRRDNLELKSPKHYYLRT